jgi:hypothetical protein
LTEATIKLFDYDTLMKRRPLPVLPPWLSKSRPHVLEIENPTRKYILSAKSLFDLQEWYKAIFGHIETLSENQNIAQNNHLVRKKEKEISSLDFTQINKTVGRLRLEIQNPGVIANSTLISNQAQLCRLLNCIDDTFIVELLSDIAQYKYTCDKSEEHPQDKANSLLDQLKTLRSKIDP